MIYECFIQVCVLFFHSFKSIFEERKFYSLLGSNHHFFFMDHALVVVTKKSLPNLRPQRFLYLLWFTFSYFLYGAKYELRFNLFCIWSPVVAAHFLKRLSFVHLITCAPCWKIYPAPTTTLTSLDLITLFPGGVVVNYFTPDCHF